jgi:hypothetical protein
LRGGLFWKLQHGKPEPIVFAQLIKEGGEIGVVLNAEHVHRASALSNRQLAKQEIKCTDSRQ